MNDVCFSCLDSTKYTCLMCINHLCMPCSVFEDDESSGLESTQFGGELRVVFFRECYIINRSLKETDFRKELDELRHS